MTKRESSSGGKPVEPDGMLLQDQKKSSGRVLAQISSCAMCISDSAPGRDACKLMNNARTQSLASGCEQQQQVKEPPLLPLAFNI
eukprot:1145943-Pelagomonas_calceolata.AAC.2